MYGKSYYIEEGRYDLAHVRKQDNEAYLASAGRTELFKGRPYSILFGLLHLLRPMSLDELYRILLEQSCFPMSIGELKMAHHFYRELFQNRVLLALGSMETRRDEAFYAFITSQEPVNGIAYLTSDAFSKEPVPPSYTVPFLLRPPMPIINPS